MASNNDTKLPTKLSTELPEPPMGFLTDVWTSDGFYVTIRAAHRPAWLERDASRKSLADLVECGFITAKSAREIRAFSEDRH